VRDVLDGPVLVACSGGADSLALAAAVAFEAPRRQIPAGLITIDHGLQSGSAEQADRIASLGYEFGMDPVELVRVSVGTAGGPEAAARTARYRALQSAAEALDRDVLLGHTLDDQAETVLLGLGRGSGPRSIAGMRIRSGRFVRPLLSVRRETTVAACAALGLEPWRDPHNDDPSFQRVRLRREVLPLLEDVLHGGVADALARTAALLQDDLDALDALVALPKALRTRTLRSWARSLRADPLARVHLAALDALVTDWHGQGPVDLPGGAQARRVSGRIVGKPADGPE
jgi:tRNA(Ile)-lysidine synthase